MTQRFETVLGPVPFHRGRKAIDRVRTDEIELCLVGLHHQADLGSQRFHQALAKFKSVSVLNRLWTA